MSGAVYESDPEAAPDSSFVAGRLEHLVIGNEGRLLDARRTPIRIMQVDASRGVFALEIRGFEDAGARWELPVEDVERFQFAQGAREAAPGIVAELERSVALFDAPLAIERDATTREMTLGKIARARADVGSWLSRRGALATADLERHIASRTGDRRLMAVLDGFLAARDVGELDHELAHQLVSNPASGELVKGHAIVLAELGLVPYRGKVIRDPGLFDEPRSRGRRAEHLISRLAFMQELWSTWGYADVTLYRAAAADGPLIRRPAASLTSATFSRQVADAHFEGGPTTRTAMLWRGQIPISRLFMTFLETAAMNRRFHEAEAIVLGDLG